VGKWGGVTRMVISEGLREGLGYGGIVMVQGYGKGRE
jgi:hypothetical protein